MIEFRILGSLEVVERDRLLALGSPQQRALLAVLLLHRGDPVSSDRLIDELWGEQAPASAIKIVQGYVSNLRKVLGDGLLITRGRGVPAARLSLARLTWTALSRLSRKVDGRRRKAMPRAAAARLRDALGLWRGPPLADLRTSRSRSRRSRGWRNHGWPRWRSGSTRSSRSASTAG